MAAKGKFFDRQTLAAFATLIGTAIGAGLFGLPYVASRAGFFPAMTLMFLLALLMLISNLMYGEIILRTRGNCRLVGCAHRYLGEKGGHITSFTSFLSLYSGNLVYIILSGIFLSSFLSPILGGDEFTYAIIAFAFVSLVTYLDTNIFSLFESWMVLVMLIIIATVSSKGVPYIDMANYLTSEPSQFFFPFGVMLFSLGASSAVPEIVRIVTRRRERIVNILSWGTMVYTLFYAIFIAAVVGVTGAETSEEAFRGLSIAVGDGVITAGFVLGFLAIITSYLVSNIAIKEILQFDYGMKTGPAWFLSCIVPLLLFLLGFRDFIKVINFAGGITGGLIGILIIIIFYNAKRKGDRKPEYTIDVSYEISFLMIIVYILGIIYEIIYDL